MNMADYRTYFNTTDSKALATADESGRPDVALCGTAFMPDDTTIAAAYGFFDVTRKNIAANGKAVFLASKPTTQQFWKHYDETGDQEYAAGIRYHCTLKEQTESHPWLDIIKRRFRKRVGNRIPDGIKGLWIFTVDEIREHAI
jgi:hypothetical protein